MTSKEHVFFWVMVAAAGLTGLGHQLQIQVLKEEVSLLQRLRQMDRSDQNQTEENLTKAIMTLVDFRAQDNQRTKAAVDDVYMRCRIMMENK